jgi:hypothetical protein
MLNDGLCNVESFLYNVHELLMRNGELCNVELTPNNIQEHMLESNMQIYEGKSGGNMINVHFMEDMPSISHQ